MKRCLLCQEEKILAAFQNDKSKLSGKRTECKECTSKRRRELIRLKNARVPIGWRLCTFCRIVKLIDEFPGPHSGQQKRHITRCRACQKESSTKARVQHIRQYHESAALRLEQGQKRCASCGERKSLSAFTVMRRSVDGYDIYCRPCNTKKARLMPFGQLKRR